MVLLADARRDLIEKNEPARRLEFARQLNQAGFKSRAHFIRCQLELNNNRHRPAYANRLRKEINELLDKEKYAVLGIDNPAHLVGAVVSMKDGFIDRAEVAADHFDTTGRYLLENQFVQFLTVTDVYEIDKLKEICKNELINYPTVKHLKLQTGQVPPFASINEGNIKVPFLNIHCDYYANCGNNVKKFIAEKVKDLIGLKIRLGREYAKIGEFSGIWHEKSSKFDKLQTLSVGMNVKDTHQLSFVWTLNNVKYVSFHDHTIGCFYGCNKWPTSPPHAIALFGGDTNANVWEGTAANYKVKNLLQSGFGSSIFRDIDISATEGLFVQGRYVCDRLLQKLKRRTFKPILLSIVGHLTETGIIDFLSSPAHTNRLERVSFGTDLLTQNACNDLADAIAKSSLCPKLKEINIYGDSIAEIEREEYMPEELAPRSIWYEQVASKYGY